MLEVIYKPEDDVENDTSMTDKEQCCKQRYNKFFVLLNKISRKIVMCIFSVSTQMQERICEQTWDLKKKQKKH
jgi:hypothetical protein